MIRPILRISLILSLQTLVGSYASDLKAPLDAELNKLNKALEANQDDKSLLETRANCLINLSKYNEAIDDCNKAIKIDEQDLRAYHLRAVARKALGQLDAAKEDGAKLSQLANELNDQNANREIQSATERIKKNPSDAAAYVVRASAYLNQKQYQNAIADASKALELDPKSKTAYFTRMGAYLGLHRTADAKADRAKFDRIDSKDEHQFSADAIADYTHILNANAHDKNALEHRAQAYFELGKYTEAERDLSSLIKLDPSRTSAYRLRADCYRKLKESSRALADLNQAKSLAGKEQ